jgi:hypothetical protein
MAKRQKTRKCGRKNKVLKGGFYPSIMGGVTNTAYLLPLALRQGINLFRNYKRKGKGKTRKQRRKI